MNASIIYIFLCIYKEISSGFLAYPDYLENHEPLQIKGQKGM